MTNEIESINKRVTTEKNQIATRDPLSTYVLVRNCWKMRKELAKILDVNRKILFRLDKGRWMDDAGIMKGEIRHASKIVDNQHFYVLDPLGQTLGSVLCTRVRNYRWVSRYSLIGPQGQVIGIAEPSDKERNTPSYAIFSPDGGVLARVHKADSEDYYQLDILLPGLHPLVVLSYVWFYGDAVKYFLQGASRPPPPRP